MAVPVSAYGSCEPYEGGHGEAGRPDPAADGYVTRTAYKPGELVPLPDPLGTGEFWGPPGGRGRDRTERRSGQSWHKVAL